MIFVTVGTHEQPFDRLLQAVDAVAAATDEEFIVQTGYCNYTPQHCTHSQFYSYAEIQQLVTQARIVITHGGPSSFIMPLQVGKTPIVVPRQEQYNEHVNNHQLSFALEVQKRQKNILVLEDVSFLSQMLSEYESRVEQISGGMSSNHKAFMKRFCALVDEIV